MSHWTFIYKKRGTVSTSPTEPGDDSPSPSRSVGQRSGTTPTGKTKVRSMPEGPAVTRDGQWSGDTSPASRTSPHRTGMRRWVYSREVSDVRRHPLGSDVQEPLRPLGFLLSFPPGTPSSGVRTVGASPTRVLEPSVGRNGDLRCGPRVGTRVSGTNPTDRGSPTGPEEDGETRVQAPNGGLCRNKRVDSGTSTTH